MTQKQAPSPAGGMTQVSGPARKTPAEPACDVNLDSQSVAGEEDPGASLDMSGSSPPNRSGITVPMPSGSANPGDEAPEGTPGTGEGLCPQCGGSGRVGDAICPSCKGSGKVIVGIGGA
ncbi:hypothetical protein [Polaromonas sp. CG_9.11]|uniref:hypothetical protein n=1 Tax=Polaromonas sp. CG_9.11 TaxID=2787730 RepID=UPI000B01EC9A|nr:hypothetical protein [Polaromonas sp. CG_9.11]MBG6076120.1 hypothetical protein [Polaromonas sp. CG_9.11]